MYSLPNLPSSFLLECSQRALLEEKFLSKLKRRPGLRQQPHQAGRAPWQCLAGGREHNPAPLPSTASSAASLRNVSLVSVTAGCLESLLH